MPRVTVSVDGSQQFVDVPFSNPDLLWSGLPWKAQLDIAAAPTGHAPHAELLSDAGPWRTVEPVNDYSIKVSPDGTVTTLEVRCGDKPPGFSGGDRAAWDLNASLIPNGADLVGVDGRLLVYRVEFMLPSANAVPLLYHNNFSEWHGKASGASVLKIAPNGGGDSLGVHFTPFVKGVWGASVWYDLHKMVYGHWENYDLEVLWKADAGGYFRVWRDGVCKTIGAPGADASGKVTGQTMKTFADGSTENTGYACQLYRNPLAADGSVYAPSFMQVRNIAVGKTVAALH